MQCGVLLRSKGVAMRRVLSYVTRLQHGMLLRMPRLLQVLVDVLREKCLEERLDLAGPAAAVAASATGGGSVSAGYSSLTTAPEDWRLDPARPCSGERLLLMFDRWVL